MCVLVEPPREKCVWIFFSPTPFLQKISTNYNHTHHRTYLDLDFIKNSILKKQNLINLMVFILERAIGGGTWSNIRIYPDIRCAWSLSSLGTDFQSEI